MIHPSPRSTLFPYTTLFRSIGQASLGEKISLIASHPDLAGKAAIEGNLSAMSVAEQAAAGLDKLSAEEYAEFSRQIRIDRKSTRLNSSHSQISYAVFCLKKK